MGLKVGQDFVQGNWKVKIGNWKLELIHELALVQGNGVVLGSFGSAVGQRWDDAITCLGSPQPFPWVR